MTAAAYRLSYHPDVKAVDLPKIDQKNQAMIKRAIEDRLLSHPERYGAKLQRTFRNYWKLRVGQYRIIFSLTGNQIRVFAIIHRKDVYQAVEKRLE